MKWMIASDIHGSAYYCNELLMAYKREKADRLLLLEGHVKTLTSTTWKRICAEENNCIIK